MLVSPVLKWVGGKRQLIDEIMPRIPSHTKYVEPFVGGAAILFELQPHKAIINDSNAELINVYNMIKEKPDELIKKLMIHESNNSEDYYYSIRELDRDKTYNNLSALDKAARIIYLNKTCYNGLFRVNSAGEFNTPYGKYKNPNIVNSTTIKEVSLYLNENEITILNLDFKEAIKNLRKDCFVYFDPPYVPISSSSSFTGYTEGGFSLKNQKELKIICDGFTKRGIKFMQSNSDSPFVRELYRNYTIVSVKARRSINSDAGKRGGVGEVLIMNYE